MTKAHNSQNDCVQHNISAVVLWLFNEKDGVGKLTETTMNENNVLLDMWLPNQCYFFLCFSWLFFFSTLTVEPKLQWRQGPLRISAQQTGSHQKAHIRIWQKQLWKGRPWRVCLAECSTSSFWHITMKRCCLRLLNGIQIQMELLLAHMVTHGCWWSKGGYEWYLSST